MGISLAQQTAPYLEYNLSIRFFWNSGLADMPVAYQTGVPATKTVEMVQVSQAHGRKVVTFEITRANALPQPPDPSPASTNEVLLDASVETSDPKEDISNSRYTYTMRGVYTYSLLVPVFVTGAWFPAGAHDSGQQQSLQGQFLPGET